MTPLIVTLITFPPNNLSDVDQVEVFEFREVEKSKCTKPGKEASAQTGSSTLGVGVGRKV